MNFPQPRLSSADAEIVRETSPLTPRVDLAAPQPMRICFPVLLDGDLVMSSEHLGVSYLVSILRDAGAECSIVEVPGNNQGDAAAIDEIAAWKPDVIGFSLTTVLVSHATAFGKGLREALGPSTYFLAGGPLATFLGTRLLANPNWRFLDGLVRGEGDIAMIRFAEAFWSKSDLSGVPNLSWRDSDGEIHDNLFGLPLSDLDLLPEPARDQMELHDGKLPYLRLATTRGCTARCTFCNAPHAGNKIGPGKLWRARAPENIVDEIERLYNKFNFNTFDFVDSTFEDPGGAPFAKQRIADIAQDILDRNLKIYYNCCMQARNWSDKDKDLIDLLYRSGLEKVLIGVESGSDIGLKRWKKKSNSEDNIRAINLLRDAGVYVAFGFIAFHPWSCFDEIRENNEFLRRFMGYNLRRFTVRLELYPGAEVVTQLRMEGMLDESFDLSLNPLAYSFHDPRVQRLADVSSLLYGSVYRDEVVIEDEPAVFRFETYDIVLHTYLSRLRRHFIHHEQGRGLIEEAETRAEEIRSKLSSFNYELISELVDKAEAETLEDDYAVKRMPEVEQYYQDRLDEFRSLQLRTSVKLHRAGIPIKQIQFS